MVVVVVVVDVGVVVVVVVGMGRGSKRRSEEVWVGLVGLLGHGLRERGCVDGREGEAGGVALGLRDVAG